MFLAAFRAWHHWNRPSLCAGFMPLGSSKHWAPPDPLVYRSRTYRSSPSPRDILHPSLGGTGCALPGLRPCPGLLGLLVFVVDAGVGWPALHLSDSLSGTFAVLFPWMRFVNLYFFLTTYNGSPAAGNCLLNDCIKRQELLVLTLELQTKLCIMPCGLAGGSVFVELLSSVSELGVQKVQLFNTSSAVLQVRSPVFAWLHSTLTRARAGMCRATCMFVPNVGVYTRKGEFGYFYQGSLVIYGRH